MIIILLWLPPKHRGEQGGNVQFLHAFPSFDGWSLGFTLPPKKKPAGRIRTVAFCSNDYPGLVLGILFASLVVSLFLWAAARVVGACPSSWG